MIIKHLTTFTFRGQQLSSLSAPRFGETHGKQKSRPIFVWISAADFRIGRGEGWGLPVAIRKVHVQTRRQKLFSSLSPKGSRQNKLRGGRVQGVVVGGNKSANSGVVQKVRATCINNRSCHREIFKTDEQIWKLGRKLTLAHSRCYHLCARPDLPHQLVGQIHLTNWWGQIHHTTNW